METRKIHAKLHPGLEWRVVHILTREDVDEIIFRLFVQIIKRKLHGGSKIRILVFSSVKNNRYNSKIKIISSCCLVTPTCICGCLLFN